jgi:hypothetical protein
VDKAGKTTGQWLGEGLSTDCTQPQGVFSQPFGGTYPIEKKGLATFYAVIHTTNYKHKVLKD